MHTRLVVCNKPRTAACVVLAVCAHLDVLALASNRHSGSKHGRHTDGWTMALQLAATQYRAGRDL